METNKSFPHICHLEESYLRNVTVECMQHNGTSTQPRTPLLPYHSHMHGHPLDLNLM